MRRMTAPGPTGSPPAPRRRRASRDQLGRCVDPCRAPARRDAQADLRRVVVDEADDARVRSRGRLSISSSSRMPAEPAPTMSARVSMRRTAARSRRARARCGPRRGPAHDDGAEHRSSRNTERGKPRGRREDDRGEEEHRAERRCRARCPRRRARSRAATSRRRARPIQKPTSLQASRSGSVDERDDRKCCAAS